MSARTAKRWTSSAACVAFLVACHANNGASGSNDSGYDLLPDALPPLPQTPDDACPADALASGPAPRPNHGGIGAIVSLVSSSVPTSTGSVGIFFGDTRATILSTTPTEFLVQVPEGAKSGHVTVVVGCAAAKPTNDDLFTVDTTPAPVIDSFSPTSASAAAHTVVTLAGSHFTGARHVFMGLPDRAPDLSFVVISDTSIQFVTSGTAVTGPIGVTTQSGPNVSKADFTMTP